VAEHFGRGRLVSFARPRRDYPPPPTLAARKCASYGIFSPTEDQTRERGVEFGSHGQHKCVVKLVAVRVESISRMSPGQQDARVKSPTTVKSIPRISREL
jgi:hypothetical protein